MDVPSNKRMLCRRVLEGWYCTVIFSAEFGALFSHHWNGLYKEMEIERQQRPILQHVSADSHFPSLSRR